MNPPPLPTGAESVEQIRNRHLNHEASIQGVGSLYLLGAILIPLMAAGMLFSPQTDKTVATVITAILIPIALIQVWVGLKLRKLEASAKIPATILSGLGLLSIPVGTIINGYILYLLHCAKGKYVFSEEYKGVRAATPHIKYKTSIIVKIFLGLLLLLILVAIVGALKR